MKATALRNKREVLQQLCISNAIWRTEEKYSYKAKDISSGIDTTKNEIVPNNPGALLPPTAHGNIDTISKLINVTSGASRGYNTVGTVCEKTHTHISRQL